MIGGIGLLFHPSDNIFTAGNFPIMNARLVAELSAT
jgi:hypothetical protein